MNDALRRLKDLSIPPPVESGGYEAWLEAKECFEFLAENEREDEFVVYAGLPLVFLHAVTVPKRFLKPADADDLLKWNGNPWTSWGATYSRDRVYVSSPLHGIDSKTLAKGEQLVFGRTFEGRADQKSYFEVLQKFSHLFDLHYVFERQAYCRLNKLGDIEDAIKIVTLSAEGDHWGGTVVTFQRRLLDEYMALTNTAIARMFEFDRLRLSGFGGWSNDRSETRASEKDLYYKFGLEKGRASYARGVQVVRTSDSKQRIVDRMWHGEEAQKQYASFIAQDWKNNVVKEISCDPKCLANYFTKSDLPYEVTPAFFRPEILLRYKADHEKYRVENRSITCRGAWSLQTYDINDAGQVHTYLIYLSRLPYEEQLYWKSFNEPPKAPISKRALTTDFEGEFSQEYDALESLKHELHELEKQGVLWWKLRSQDLITHIHYPVTQSADDWADELLALDQLITEGLEEKFLRKKSEALGRSPDPRLRSLKLAEECLLGLGFEASHARTALAPLHEVHNLRSIMKGHASGEEAKKIRASLLSKFGTYRKHFQALCAECDDSVRLLAQAFNLPTDQGAQISQS